MVRSFPRYVGLVRVRLLAWVSTLAALVSAATVLAHEVQPTVADVTMGSDRALIELDWIIEAPVAGLDLEGVSNTNDAVGAEIYDRLRALDPVALEDEFRRAWADIAPKITARSGDSAVPLAVERVTIPEAGNFELARNSQVVLTADLPDGTAGLVFGWDASLGPLVVRQIGVEGGYAAFLENGRLSDPIPRAGGPGDATGAPFASHIRVGFEHVIPFGLDHVLFVLGLFFLAARASPLLWMIPTLTLGHIVALPLGAFGVVSVPGDIAEPLIAAMIVYVGVENVLARGLTPWRLVIVFGFGLVHGLSFASVLRATGLDAGHFVLPLVGVNIGVEIGQIAVVAAAFLCFGWLFWKHRWYKTRVAAPVSSAIALIGLFWVLERTGTVPGDGVLGPITALTEGGMPVLMGAGAALLVMVVVTALVFVTDSDTLRDWGGFATSFVAFVAVIGAFTALDYTIMAGLVLAWIVLLRLLSIGGLDAPEAS